jgi:hypothetical protein
LRVFWKIKPYRKALIGGEILASLSESMEVSVGIALHALQKDKKTMEFNDHRYCPINRGCSSIQPSLIENSLDSSTVPCPGENDPVER